MSFVVTGASGHTGKIVADTLLANKRPVRVVLRDAAKGEGWKQKGAEVAVADMENADALARALQGAAAAYLLIPPSFTQPDFRAYEDRVSDAIAQAVEANRIPHVVLLSSLGAEHPTGTGPIVGLQRAEQKLRRIAGTATSIIRAGYFLENLGSSLGTLAKGTVSSFFPANHPIEATATDDIGRLAATLLLEGAQKTEVVELGGPAITMNDVAATLTRITGKPIKVEEAPLDAMVPVLTGFGLTKDLAELYREMNEAMIKGRIGFEGGHRRVSTTTSLETVLRRLISA